MKERESVCGTERQIKGERDRERGERERERERREKVRKERSYKVCPRKSCKLKRSNTSTVNYIHELIIYDVVHRERGERETQRERGREKVSEIV